MVWVMKSLFLCIIAGFTCFYSGFSAKSHDVIQKMENYAKNGDVNSQYYIASMYDHGVLVARDESIAEYYYKKSISSGKVDGVFRLSMIVLSKIESEMDAKFVEKLLIDASSKNHSEAQYQLGMMYLTGEYVSSSPDSSKILFSKAAKNGNGDAQYQLGVIHLEGNGVKKNIPVAIRWFVASADSGAGELYKEQESSAEKSLIILARIYGKGIGIKKDSRKSLRFYKEAALRRNERAMYMLSRMYSRGLSVELDLIEAMKWVILAKSKAKTKLLYGKISKQYKSIRRRMSNFQYEESKRIAKKYHFGIIPGNAKSIWKGVDGNRPVFLIPEFLYYSKRNEENANYELLLAAMGYNPGPIDGIIDPVTRKSLQDFKKDNGLQSQTGLDSKTKKMLKITWEQHDH